MNMAPSLISSSASVENIWSHQSYAGYVALNAAVVFGIALWDYIQLLPEEKSLYDNLGGSEWHSPAPWAFILLRYSTLVSTLSSVIYSSLRIQHCELAMSVGQGASATALGSAGILFCCRVGSLWDYRKAPLAAGIVSCFIMISAWVTVATQYRSMPGIHLPFGTNCQFTPLAEWTAISPAAAALFNCCIFGLTISRMVTKCTMVATNTGLTLINRACLIYLSFSTIGSIAVLGISAFNWKDDLAKRVSPPYLVLISMAMGSRIFLNLRLHSNMLSRFEESNHFTAKKWSPDDLEKPSTTGPTLSHRNEPSFDPALTMLSVPASDTYTTMTLTIPDTATSFTESTYGAPAHSLRTVSSPLGNVPELPKSPKSITSFATYSTRMTSGVVPEMPEIQERARTRSMKSVSSTSTHRTNSTRAPPSPRRKPVPSIKSLESTSTNASPSKQKPRRERMESFKYFATTSNLKPEEIKSTWHGI